MFYKFWWKMMQNWERLITEKSMFSKHNSIFHLKIFRELESISMKTKVHPKSFYYYHIGAENKS